MSAARTVGMVVGGVVVLAAGLVLALPGHCHVERSLTIKAPPDIVHASVGDLKTWESWTAWTVEKDATLKREYGSVSAGVGAEVRWTGEQMGSGRIVVTQSDPTTGITYDFSFDDMAPSVGRVQYTATPEGTLVTWSSDMDFGFNPIGRVMGLWMDGWVGPDFEEGLKHLRLRAEGEAHQAEERKKAEEKARAAAAAAAEAAAAAAAAAEAAAAAAQAVQALGAPR